MKTHDFQKDSSWFGAPHHESPHPLLLDSLRLLLLLTLRVGVPGGDGSGELLHLTGHRAVILFEVLGMLKDAVEIFLKNKSQVFVSVPVTADTTLSFPSCQPVTCFHTEDLLDAVALLTVF